MKIVDNELRLIIFDFNTKPSEAPLSPNGKLYLMKKCLFAFGSG